MNEAEINESNADSNATDPIVISFSDIGFGDGFRYPEDPPVCSICSKTPSVFYPYGCPELSTLKQDCVCLECAENKEPVLFDMVRAFQNHFNDADVEDLVWSILKDDQLSSEYKTSQVAGGPAFTLSPEGLYCK